jgi:hypothetical protein
MTLSGRLRYTNDNLAPIKGFRSGEIPGTTA